LKLFPKLALTISTLLAITTLCLSMSYYWAERRSIRAQADEERFVLLQSLAHIAQESILTNDDLLLVKYTHHLLKWNKALVSASVVDPQGEILAHSQPNQIGKPIERDKFKHSPTEVLVLTQPVRLGQRWVATVSAGFSERVFEETVASRLQQLRKRLALIGGGAIGVGLMISFLLALSWTQPVASLVQAAHQVGAGKYQVDLATTNSRRDELGYLSRAFQSMTEQLRELDRMKEDFVTAVTHELRSPLGAIESYLNLIREELREGISPDGWRTYLERLSVNTQRLTRFINDLLDVAALERGKITLARQAVDLTTLIQEVANLYAATFAERKIDYRTTIPEDRLPLVWIDPDKIRQVLINLLSNAIKFTPEGGAIETGLESAPGTGFVRVFVRDSGLGIAEADLARIFNKFEQVRTSRFSVKGPKGTGLGLAICRALLELHEGTLGVQSRLGEGSCFYFTLPMVTAATLPSQAPAEGRAG
jgi:signal transduction histidine kinase